MKVLVTGGAGFIGNALVMRLIKEGHEVTSWDRTKYSGLREHVHEVYGDLHDSYSVDCYVRQHDYVFNIAGMLGTAETVENPIPAVQTNIIGALNVFNSIRRHDKECTHITVGNYWMNNPYSITKSCSERFALMYNKEHDTRITVVRGLNVYGPGQKAYPVRKLIPNLIVPALKNEEIILYGTGEQGMDMIYITDAAELLYRTMWIDHEEYEDVIDMGLGQAPSVNTIAETVLQVIGSKSKIIHVPMRAGEDEMSVVVADPSTAICLGGTFQDDFKSLAEGIELALPYYKDYINAMEGGKKSVFIHGVAIK